MAGRAVGNEAVRRGGSCTAILKVPDADTGPAPLPSCPEATTEIDAAPEVEPANTGMEKCVEVPAVSRASEDGVGDPAPMGPETCAVGATETASAPPLLLTIASSVADWPVTSRAGPDRVTEREGPA